jgi:hypothetical protein
VSPGLTAAAIAAFGLAIAVVTQLALRRTRHRSVFDAPRSRQRAFWAVMTASSILVAVVAWALTTGHAAIGIGLLAAAFVLPEFVRVPLRVRRSRLRAEQARRERRR